MSSGQEGDSVSASQRSQSHCALCNVPPEFLLSYSAIPLSSCVCKANKRSLRRGLSGRFYPTMGEAKDQEAKPSCCAPGCNVTAERTCVFASLYIICAAVNELVKLGRGRAWAPK